MIFEIFNASFSDRLEADLARIEKMLLSPKFLQGIGKNSSEMSVISDVPVITDLVIAHNLMTSQEIWDLPEPWPYQYFVGEVEEAISKHSYGIGMASSERRHRLGLFKENLDSLGSKILSRLKQVYEQHDIVNFLCQNSSLESKEKLIFYAENSFQNSIEAYIEGMIKVSFLSGLDTSNFFVRMIELFEMGGLPCGWLGGVRYENGADPKECMAMLYFGSRQLK